MRALRWMFCATLVACGSSDSPEGAPLDSSTVDSDAHVDVSSDSINQPCFGACHPPSELCCNDRCVVTASCDFAVTSIDPPGGWLNGGDWITLQGAGFAKGMKVTIGDGRAPVKVIDATKARVQTPPGPVGPTDVTLTLGSNTAKLPLAFVYHSNGLSTPWAQKPMKQVRGEWPGVAVLQDGRVLVAGGASTPDEPTTSLDDADLYTRSSDTVTPAAGKMSTARWRAAATTLLDGRVLVVGGACTTCTGADLFDPSADTFLPTKSGLNVPRVDPRAVLMTDGRVFVTSTNDGSIDVYDPDADAFTKIDHAQIYDEGFVVRLKDGRVLFGGGGNGSTLVQVETYDPDTGTIATVGALPKHHYWPTAHVVPDGRVLVIGGNSGGTGAWAPMQDIEIFDPKTNAWTTASYALTTPRYGHGSTLVRDGTIVVVGGYTVAGDCNSLVDTVDRIDPVKGTVTAFDKLPNKNTELSAVTLLDGSIVVVGGGACGASLALPDIDFLPGAAGPG